MEQNRSEAPATNFVVTNTTDAGAGSLRDAITSALGNSGVDMITFKIPPTDPRHFYYRNNNTAGTLDPLLITATTASDDTTIVDIDPDWPHSWYSIETAGIANEVMFFNPLTIDGFSQPGSVPNTNQSGALNSVLKIEVTNRATDFSCTRIFRAGFDAVTIQGMIINGCGTGSGAKLVDLDVASHGSVVTGNYLGTDPSGTIGIGSGYGVHVSLSSGARIGGSSPADRNLISANFRAININSGGASGAGISGASIIGNLIGTARDGTSPLGNGFHPEQPSQRENAISIESIAGTNYNNRIENNVIAFNARYGVSLAGGGVGTGQSVYANRITNNAIYSNGNVGINLDGADQGATYAVTPNDPCDKDVGMNALQNSPVIKSAVISGNMILIDGTLNSIPDRTYDLEFFASPSADPTFFGEGQTVLGTTRVTIPAGSCNGRFRVSLPRPPAAGNVITATATDPDDNTSEFSAVFMSRSESDACVHCLGGMVSWYAAEGNVNDSRGENHGTFLVTPSRYTTGKVGQAFDLGRNSADIIRVPDDPGLDLSNAFTMEMWVSPTETGQGNGTSFFISKGDINAVTTQSYGILFTPDRKVANRVGNGTTIDQLVSNSAIPLNEYSHIAATYDGTTLRVYVNGVLDASQATSIGTLLDTPGPLVIGGAHNLNGALSLAGAIDEPALYDRALSDTEIASIFAAGSAGKCYPNPNVPFDFDGDGRTDISVFRPSEGNWYLQQSSAGFSAFNFGLADDRIVPADYDGDRRTDIAVFRRSSGIWYIDESSNNTGVISIFGTAEDVTVPADYDGDGKADIAVFRPSEAKWYIANSSDGSFTVRQFGIGLDDPAVGDYDCDGKADIGVYRPVDGIWYRINSSDGSFYAESFGIATDRIVQGDYDADGHTDLAVYRPSTGTWYVKHSSDSTYHSFVFGLADDIPTPGDYDGDGRSDFAVFRPSDGLWFIANSSNGTFTIYPWGLNTDVPIPAVYVY